jgi:hypothetical protein
LINDLGVRDDRTRAAWDDRDGRLVVMRIERLRAPAVDVALIVELRPFMVIDGTGC